MVAKPAVVAVPVKLPVITPALIVTPEMAVADETYKLPPIPTPPDITKAPVDVLVEAVKAVTASPDIETMPVDGFITNDAIVERPKPVPLALFTAVIENEEFSALGDTATDEAADEGTACQEGTVPEPFDVKT